MGDNLGHDKSTGREKMQERIKQFVQGASGAFTITLLGVLIALGTGDFKNFSGIQMVAFVMGVITLIALTFFREQLNKAESKLVEQEARDSRDKLVEAVKLLPPARSLNNFSLRYGHLARLTRQTRLHGEYTHEDIEKIIRVALDSLCVLLSEYSVSGDSRKVYTANVMIFIPVAELASKPHVVRRLAFTDSEQQKLQDLDGVLWLDTNLSVTTADSKQGAKDTDAKEIALPVRSAESQNGLIEGIPAAVAAYKGCEHTYFSDTRRLMQREYYASYNLKPSIVSDLIKYFTAKYHDKHIGSIISIPLLADTSSVPKQGVVNIHCSGHISLSPAMLNSFIDISRPAIEQIKDLLLLLECNQSTEASEQ